MNQFAIALSSYAKRSYDFGRRRLTGGLTSFYRSVLKLRSIYNFGRYDAVLGNGCGSTYDY